MPLPPAALAADDYLRMMITPNGGIVGEARGRHAICVLGLAIAVLIFNLWI